MFYLLNFENHQFITCDNAARAEAEIQTLLAAGCSKDTLEVVNGFGDDSRLTVDAFRALCEEQGLLDEDHELEQGAEPQPVSPVRFTNNEECALALFLHLKEIGQVQGTEYDREAVLHDVNNLRGHEWLECLKRNLETKPFFDYLRGAEYFEDEFAYGSPVSPRVFIKAALGQDVPDSISYDEVRNLMDSHGYGELWDYCEEDLDEVIDNLSDGFAVLAVGFYQEVGYYARLFEIPPEIVNRFESMLVVTEHGCTVLPEHVHSGDRIVGPYSTVSNVAERPTLEDQIRGAKADRVLDGPDSGVQEVSKGR